MRVIALGLVGLLIAGCATNRTASTDPAASCARDAERDPAVRVARAKQAAGYYQTYLFEPEYKQAYRTALDRCLASRGLPQSGGVEAVNPGSLF